MSSHQNDRPTPEETPLGFARHDHAKCVDQGLAAAEERSRAAGLRFTPVRRKVLEILLREHRAVGAYEILDNLREAGFASQPPVAYRALEFLVTQGFAHRIERLNAFIACASPGDDHAPAFLICRGCDSVAETHMRPSDGAFGAAARATGFQVERAVIEAEGLCPACAPEAS
ncbi:MULTISPECIES: Fur family transcriptional regulator [unclassified Roseivivax]|uniref:Fur family transcriptional regulator n=1 Tax=Roseivivax sp. GX 12232 TaxID=2900547 RepID=UPI001E54A8A7|nr:Fur family transcriptional regulator [Roseivivax sp. GX 12232]MCE0504690.1 transcriptional repressor [Roseivivax sp. GX 12232]